MQLTYAAPPNVHMRPKLRTPAAHEEVLTVPDIRSAAALVAENVAQASLDSQASATVHHPRRWALEELRETGRRELIQLATAHTAGYTHVDRQQPDVTGPLILTGHQPELFHAGVWIKSFAADAIAQSTGGTGVHVLIDNDVVGRTDVAVPHQDAGSIRLQQIPLDAATEPMPHEERGIIDPILFKSFPGSRASGPR